jgi:SAM-dependent methyltransferase/uncharacterized protein YbaR (Trm112 family)
MLRPICPRCTRATGRHVPLEIRSALKQDRDSIIEGVLVCTNRQCLSEYPIIDGIPIIVADLRSYVSQSIIPILRRHDLTDTMESLLGDCFGPGSAFDAQRQPLSTYCFDHYGDLDPEESKDSPVSPGSVLKVLKKGLSGMKDKVSGPVIDIGCAVGRTTFELAETLDEIVLGVDLNFDMLRTATSILANGRLVYPRRRVGIVFDRREFPAVFDKAKNVDFWVCDACALPFADACFSFAVSLNVLDCVGAPYDHLKELARILKHDACALISTPYDWAANATPVESWLGGHSQRSENRGSSEMMLRSLLAGGGHPNAIEELAIASEAEKIPWSMRLHDRSFMEYPVHMITVRKKSVPVPS